MTATSVFDTPKPALTAPQIAAALQQHWGLSGTQKSLVSERDQNVLISTPSGQFVLKIANQAEDAGFLALQNAALAHIALTDPTLGVPRLIGEMVAHRGHMVRLMTYLPGQLYSAIPAGPALTGSLGTVLGRLSKALRGFGHPAAHRPGFIWNLDEVAALRPWLPDIAEAQRPMVARIFDRYDTRVVPHLAHLRGAVIHQDANDNNLLVSDGAVCGIIDFGDMTWGRQINELAVALAYALLDCPDIYATAAPLISAYTAVFPLEPIEAEVLFDLVAARLAASVCISSHRAKDHPDNPYLTISQAPALALLDRLDQTNPAFLAAFARHAAGLPPVADHAVITAWLASPACQPAQLFDLNLNRSGRLVLSLAPGAPGMEFTGDPVGHWQWLEQQFALHDAQFAIGLYGEDRDVYKGPQFRTAASPEARSQHLGVDIFIGAGSRLCAPLAGTVLSVVDNDLPYDYGPTVILEHQAGANGPKFWTLYGHLSCATLTTVTAGQTIAAGQLIGFIGDHTVNGGWSPHLHFQIMTDRLGLSGEFPGVGQPSLWPVWSAIVPDPNLILRLAPESFVIDPDTPEKLLARRQKVLGPNLSISYTKKLKIMRGSGAYLFDHTGRAYVDAVNNIAHVGHSHPHVVAALDQAKTLNTNTRYLHNTILDYAERLGALFPDPLSVVYLVTSGSEANELALRIARAVTGRQGIVTLDWAYHGHTNALIDISPYKFNRKGGGGKPAQVEIAMLPDPYRGPSKTAHIYIDNLSDQIAKLQSAGLPPAAMFAEAISGCGGQVFYPDGYLAEAARVIRAAGGLMVVDEVQTGFGRVGTHMWAHGPQGVVPDIVTLGKPIGNGHPMAAVITTPEIAKAFANGMEFFSSFGGNPVSAAVGMAVLDVIEAEGLQARALATGTALKAGLTDLQQNYPLIGDVRGQGLFLGVELVRDRTTLEPATNEAHAIANHMRGNGVLISTDGPFDNVLKIKPPLAFGPTEATLLTDALGAALRSFR